MSREGLPRAIRYGGMIAYKYTESAISLIFYRSFFERNLQSFLSILLPLPVLILSFFRYTSFFFFFYFYLPMAGNSDETTVPLGDATPESSASSSARVSAGRYTAAGYPSVLSEDRLAELRERYQIPDSVTLRLPGGGETPDSPPPPRMRSILRVPAHLGGTPSPPSLCSRCITKLQDCPWATHCERVEGGVGLLCPLGSGWQRGTHGGGVPPYVPPEESSIQRRLVLFMLLAPG